MKELWPGLNPGGIDQGVGLGGIFYFPGQDASGKELWRSDGTPGALGTRPAGGSQAARSRVD